MFQTQSVLFRFLTGSLLILSIYGLISFDVNAGDWPMWRYDSARSAVTEDALPEDLNLLWTRLLPRPSPAFKSKRLKFDASYEPIVYQKRVYLASSARDGVHALDSETGKDLWTFYTNGPVRFAPVAYAGKIYFGSDDGHLYCVESETGELNWKFKAVPSDRMLLGNQRLISVWPIRGGPVIDDGKIYFAAGVWSFEGVYVYCLDASNGEVIWLNDESGTIYGSAPHNAVAFGGLTPQGYLVVDGESLVVPCGAAYPAKFNLKTGALEHFELPAISRSPGGWFAGTDKEKDRLRRRGKLAFDTDVNRQEHEDKLKLGLGIPGLRSRLITNEKTITTKDKFPGVRGEIYSMAVSDGKLFLSMADGTLHCLGKGEKQGVVREKIQPVKPLQQSALDKAQALLEILRLKDSTGYLVLVGLEDGELAEALIRSSSLKLIAIESDSEKVLRLRKRWNQLRLYGSRIHLLEGDLNQVQFPPYLAEGMVVRGDLKIRDRYLNGLRPYSGRAAFPLKGKALSSLESWVAKNKGFSVRPVQGWAVVSRLKGLSGAADYVGGWKNRERHLKSPLGVLWFDDTLAHFKRSPQPLIIDGMMMSQPKDWIPRKRSGGGRTGYPLLASVYSDAYTGRIYSEEEQNKVARKFKEVETSEKIQPVQYRPHKVKSLFKAVRPDAGERINPITGLKEKRSFPKSYGCDGGIDYGSFLTLRSGTAAYYDKDLESGTVNVSGPRSGCTNSIIPAAGLLNLPYFYEGCTCSYPLPVGLALVNQPEIYEQWSAWGKEDLNGAIKRMGINFGAPGDRMTRAGTLWLDFPSRGGDSPALDLTLKGEQKRYYNHSLRVRKGRGWPWVAGSGLAGIQEVQLKNVQSGSYLVRVYLLNQQSDEGSELTLKTQDGKSYEVRLNPSKGELTSEVFELEGVKVDSGTFTLEIDGSVGLSGIELIESSLKAGELVKLSG